MSDGIYCFEVVEGQEWLLPDDENDFERFFSLEGRAATDWEPPRMTRLVRDERGRARSRSDFPWLGEYLPMFGPRAVEALGDVARRYGEFLPLSGDEACAYNVTNVLDALDHGRSRIAYFDDGAILAIEAYAFKAGEIGGAEVFKLPGRASPVLVTERFVSRVRQAGLEGVSFRLLGSL